MRTAHHDTSSESSIREARRRLLKLGVYAPPAILGAMVLGSGTAEAGRKAQPGQTITCGGGKIIVSANGNACCPCVNSPAGAPSTKCLWQRCQLGNCTACNQAIAQQGGTMNQEQCTRKMATACNCTCKRVGGGGRKRGRNRNYTCN